jgi:hypothetical protein
MPDRKLAHIVKLRDGTELRTIRDACDLIEERFSTVAKSVAVTPRLPIRQPMPRRGTGGRRRGLGWLAAYASV